MLKVIDFIKGSEVRGSIIQLGEKKFIASTGTTSKEYRTERGARKFMEKNEYIEVVDVKVDTIGDIVEVVKLDDTLVGMTEELLNIDFVDKVVSRYFDNLIDKEDLLEELNMATILGSNPKIRVIDARYSVDTKMISQNGIKVGDIVEAVNSDWSFKGKSMVLGMYYHVYADRYVAVLDNGYELFVDGNTVKVTSTPDVAMTDRIEIIADRIGFRPELAKSILKEYGHILEGRDVLFRLGLDRKKGSLREVRVTGIDFNELALDTIDTGGKILKYHMDCIKAILINYSEEDATPEEDTKFNPFSVPMKDITGYNPCNKCGGTGIVTWAMHTDGGICFKCKGTGKGSKINKDKDKK